MRTVFADTFYWLALANPKDEWHGRAKTIGQRLGLFRTVTTDEVLIEFLNGLSTSGPHMREVAVKMTRSIQGNPNIEVVPASRKLFLGGLQLYDSRKDKQYSLTDCISMELMRERQLKEVLTHDKHFKQEGFVILFDEP